MSPVYPGLLHGQQSSCRRAKMILIPAHPQRCRSAGVALICQTYPTASSLSFSGETFTASLVPLALAQEMFPTEYTHIAIALKCGTISATEIEHHPQSALEEGLYGGRHSCLTTSTDRRQFQSLITVRPSQHQEPKMEPTKTRGGPWNEIKQSRKTETPAAEGCTGVQVCSTTRKWQGPVVLETKF